jgi:ABC-type sugar transport system ATPase subunit
MPTEHNPELVRIAGVSKSFPGVQALSGVDLSIRSGEVLALVGENGAGKSTLMKILSGIYPTGSYEGQIYVDGKPVRFRSPLEATQAGIAIIHQELAPFSHLTVAENLFVGHWHGKNGLVDWRKLEEDAQYWLDRVGAPCKAGDLMESLSVGAQQLVEIAKALSRNSRVLVLDEPTSALSAHETRRLFELIRELRSSGKALVYISHKMDEIYEIADRMVVLRDGKSVYSAPKAELPESILISHMVGRSLDRLFPERPEKQLGEVLLSVQNLTGALPGGKESFGPLSFELRRGEILGFAGLLGAGRSEVMKAIYGNPSPREGLRNKIFYISEDRKRESILAERSLEENLSLARLAAGSLLKVLDLKTEFMKAKESLKQLRAKSTGPEQEIQALSGGNQQKVVIARALQAGADVIIFDEPTRGVDVGAKYEIYEILFDLAKKGKGVLVVSSDLPELMGISDRILVLHQGRLMGCLERDEFSQEKIMTLAVGRKFE